MKGFPSARSAVLAACLLASFAAVAAGGANETLEPTWRLCESLAQGDFPTRVVTAARENGDRLWIGTDRGVAWTDDNAVSWVWIDLSHANRVVQREGLGPGGAAPLTGEALRRRNRVTCIAFSSGEVWVGTQNGLCVGRERARSWTVYGREHGLDATAVTAVDTYGGAVWVATTRGLFVSYDHGGRWKRIEARLRLPDAQRAGFPPDIRSIEVGEGLSGTAVWLAGFETPAARRPSVV